MVSAELAGAIAIGGLIFLGVSYQQQAKAALSPTLQAPTPTFNSDNKEVTASVISSSSYTTPEQAYKMIQEGQVQSLRTRKISKHFTWGDVFVSDTVSTSAEVQNAILRKQNVLKRDGMTILRNAKRHADYLDRVRDAYGKAIRIVSWYRSNSKSQHGEGLATDFAGGKAEHLAILNTAKKLSQKGGAGVSLDSCSFRKLHLDSGPKRTWRYNCAGDDINGSISGW